MQTIPPNTNERKKNMRGDKATYLDRGLVVVLEGLGLTILQEDL